jgi:hypothetical protein
MYTTGTYIVCLPFQEKWASILPTYTDSMEATCPGQIGIVRSAKADKHPEWISINMGREIGTWWFIKEWIRPATEEEIRGHKFTLAVHKI